MCKLDASALSLSPVFNAIVNFPRDTVDLAFGIRDVDAMHKFKISISFTLNPRTSFSCNNQIQSTSTQRNEYEIEIP